MNLFTKIVLLAITLLVLAVMTASGVVLFRISQQEQDLVSMEMVAQDQEEREMETEEEVDISDWRTYRNEEWGFEFRYPEDWFISQNIASRADARRVTDHSLILRGKFIPGRPMLVVIAESPNFGPPDPMVYYTLEEDQEGGIIITDRQEFTEDRTGTSFYERDSVILSGGVDRKESVYFFQFFQEVRYDYEQIFQDILSTFRFLDAVDEEDVSIDAVAGKLCRELEGTPLLTSKGEYPIMEVEFIEQGNFSGNGEEYFIGCGKPLNPRYFEQYFYILNAEKEILFELREVAGVLDYGRGNISFELVDVDGNGINEIFWLTWTSGGTCTYDYESWYLYSLYKKELFSMYTGVEADEECEWQEIPSEFSENVKEDQHIQFKEYLERRTEEE